MESGIHYNFTDSQFEKCFLEYRPLFIQKAIRYVRNEDVASDIVSESFMTLWETRNSISSETNIPGYTFTIVKNKCLNYLRDQARHHKAKQRMHSVQSDLIDIDIASLTACDPNVLFHDEIFEILHKTLKKMPARTRACFLRSRFDNKSYKEIAKEFDISYFSVNDAIRNSLYELRIALKDYLEVIILLIYCTLRY